MKFKVKYKKDKVVISTWYDDRPRILWSVKVEQDSQDATVMWSTLEKMANILNKLTDREQRLFMSKWQRKRPTEN